MSILNIEKILNVIGPGRTLYIGPQAHSTIIKLLDQGVDAFAISEDIQSIGTQTFTAGKISRILNPKILFGEAPSSVTFDSIIVDIKVFISKPDITALIKKLHSLTRKALVIWVDTTTNGVSHLPHNGKREPFESKLINAGFRRHPRGMGVADYHAANNPYITDFLFFECLPKAILKKWPMKNLLKSRDLHMDMLRESSPRADAHIIRYVLAADWIRPGDTVLDCACGLGYGTYTLSACSRGSQFIGIDIDDNSINYARDLFGHDTHIRYESASASNLDFIPDNSVDIVISFETIEHLKDYHPFMNETARILKPDGRFIASVPNLWINDVGEDPNPYHHHVFDYEKLHGLVSRYYIPEARYSQDAPGGFKLWQSDRSLIKRPLNGSTPDTEWWIIIAANDPYQKKGENYYHPEFGHIPNSKGYCLTDFASHYDNPWIYRQIVQMGERIRDINQLTLLATKTRRRSNPSSPDYGAALTVIGYQALNQNQTEKYESLLHDISEYCKLKSNNPHTIRWQISTAFLAGRISMSWGERYKAIEYFNWIIKTDACQFSPLLTTKVIAACFWKGVIQLVDGHPDQARDTFLGGTDEARRALHFSHLNVIGDNQAPLAFGFSELAEVSDMAAQCATAVKYLPYFKNNPGLFWKNINVKRFGLATWALNLSRENDELRHKMSIIVKKKQLPNGPPRKTISGDLSLQNRLNQLLSELRKNPGTVSIRRQVAATYFNLGDLDSFLKEISVCVTQVGNDIESDLLAEDLSVAFPLIRKDNLLNTVKDSPLLIALKGNQIVAGAALLKSLKNLLTTISRKHTDEEKDSLLYSVDLLAALHNDLDSFLQKAISKETERKFRDFLTSYFNNLASCYSVESQNKPKSNLGLLRSG